MPTKLFMAIFGTGLFTPAQACARGKCNRSYHQRCGYHHRFACTKLSLKNYLLYSTYFYTRLKLAMQDSMQWSQNQKSLTDETPKITTAWKESCKRAIIPDGCMSDMFS